MNLYHTNGKIKINPRVMVIIIVLDLIVTGYLLWFFLGHKVPSRSVGTVQVGDSLRLKDCPSSPNCVCSSDSDESKSITPIPVPDGTDPSDYFLNFSKYLEDASGFSEFLTKEGNYFHALFKTPIMRFPDDFEALLDPDNRVIHIKSSSRVGVSDLGKNKKRAEAIRIGFISN